MKDQDKLQSTRLGEKKGKVGEERERESSLPSKKRMEPAKWDGGWWLWAVSPPHDLKSSVKWTHTLIKCLAWVGLQWKLTQETYQRAKCGIWPMLFSKETECVQTGAQGPEEAIGISVYKYLREFWTCWRFEPIVPTSLKCKGWHLGIKMYEDIFGKAEGAFRSAQSSLCIHRVLVPDTKVRGCSSPVYKMV